MNFNPVFCLLNSKSRITLFPLKYTYWTQAHSHTLRREIRLGFTHTYTYKPISIDKTSTPASTPSHCQQRQVFPHNHNPSAPSLIFTSFSKYLMTSTPGDVTRNLLMPLLPRVEQVTGVDISQEMVSFASKTFQHNTLAFRQLDIEKTVQPRQVFPDGFSKVGWGRRAAGGLCRAVGRCCVLVSRFSIRFHFLFRLLGIILINTYIHKYSRTRTYIYLYI